MVALRSALNEARALGWTVEYIDPAEEIRKNWKAAFEKETWTDGVKELDIQTSEEFVRHLELARRLNPRRLQIEDASSLRDLSSFRGLSRLRWVWVW